MLTVARAREVLIYDPDSGFLIWNTRPGDNSFNGRNAGKIAGKDDTRHIQVGIDGTRYMAHRVIWLMVYGVWPTNIIDHINGDGKDNRLSNLREATMSQNQMNKGRMVNNVSGFKGVCSNGPNWRATIRVNNRQISLGTFKTKDEAYAAYCNAAQKLHGSFVKLV